MAVVDARVPTRAPGVELLGPLRDSGYTETRCVVRRPDGQMIQVTSLLYSLLEAVDGHRDLAELAGELTRACGKAVAPEDVELLLAEKLAPLGLLCDADGAAPPAREPVPLLALRWKVVVTDPDATGRLTAPFTALFRRSVVVPVLLAFVATSWWVLFREGLASGVRQAFDSPGLLLAAFALVLVSAGWHEFGHAAACRAAGARPGAMGAGLYMVWPAFYTDVDDSRRLRRSGRLMVDLGGLYFNAVAAVAVMAVWLVVRADALLLVVAAQHLLMVRQLAPVIRADGYHILSDLVGVPDLFQHIRPTLAGMLPTNWGKPQPLRPAARWVVRAWVLLVVPLLLWLFVLGVLLLPRLVATAWEGVRRQGEAIVSRSGDGDVVGVLAAFLETASLVVPVAAITYMLTRVVRRTARSVWSSTEERPVARVGVSVVAAALALFLAAAWWPAGQYQPVSADEKLTFTNLLNTRTVAEPGFRPMAGVRPVPGYALIPRGDSDASTMLVTRTEDGSVQAILTDGAEAGVAEAGVAFPFSLPAPPGDGDTQALAVNTGDGTVVYDVAVAMVWVTDGAPADNRNEAYALASCTACTTVAVSFQVVLVVGQTDVVAPVNVAVAANGGCVSCTTTALAVQLVVTLREMPSEELQDRMDEALARLDTDITDLDRLYAEVQAVQAEIVTLLADAGLIAGEPPSSTTASTVVTTSTTTPGSSSSSTSTTTTSTTPSSPAGSTTTTTTAESTTTTTTTEPSTTTTTAPPSS